VEAEGTVTQGVANRVGREKAVVEDEEKDGEGWDKKRGR